MEMVFGVCGAFGGAGSGCNFVYMCIYNYAEGDHDWKRLMECLYIKNGTLL